MKLITLRCPACGAELRKEETKSALTCEFCGSKCLAQTMQQSRETPSPQYAADLGGVPTNAQAPGIAVKPPPDGEGESKLTTVMRKGTPRKKSKWRSVLETILTMVIAVCVVLFLRLFVFEIAVVDGTSMQPTLQPSERVLVMKWRQKVGIANKRGEIVVTRFPNDPGYFIKRVIALEGDRVRITGGVTYVNDQPNEMGSGYTPQNMDEMTVPEGHVWVMGDNRGVSKDSHSLSVGPIPCELLLGRADVLVYPLNRIHFLTHVKDTISEEP